MTGSRYPAAGYGYFKTKYSAVRNFRRVLTERLILTFCKYSVFVSNCQAIQKSILVNGS